jgi:hypothetical protein
MKRIVILAALLLSMTMPAAYFTTHRITAEAASRDGSGQGAPRSVCITNCLRKYEKCQSKSAGSSAQINACYQQYMTCQQSCN